MTKNLLKSIFLSNIPLVICTMACLFVSNFIILYELSFAYKIAYMNLDNQYIIEMEDKNFSELQNRVKNLNYENYHTVYYYLGNGIVVADAYNDMIHAGRRIMSPEEALTSNASIPLGAKVHYKEQVYTIVGLASFEGETLILTDTVSADEKIAAIMLRAKNATKQSQSNAKISSVFNDCNIIYPKKITFTTAVKDNPIFMLLAIVFLLAVFTYAICIRYLFLKTYKPVTVYLFLGFSVDFLLIQLIKFIFGFILSVFVLSSGAFAIYDAVMAADITLPHISLGIADYLIVFGLFIIFSIPMLLPVIKDLTKKSVGYKYV